MRCFYRYFTNLLLSHFGKNTTFTGHLGLKKEMSICSPICLLFLAQAGSFPSHGCCSRHGWQGRPQAGGTGMPTCSHHMPPTTHTPVQHSPITVKVVATRFSFSGSHHGFSLLLSQWATVPVTHTRHKVRFSPALLPSVHCCCSTSGLPCPRLHLATYIRIGSGRIELLHFLYILHLLFQVCHITICSEGCH